MVYDSGELTTLFIGIVLALAAICFAFVGASAGKQRRSAQKRLAEKEKSETEAEVEAEPEVEAGVEAETLAEPVASEQPVEVLDQESEAETVSDDQPGEVFDQDSALEKQRSELKELETEVGDLQAKEGGFYFATAIAGFFAFIALIVSPWSAHSHAQTIRATHDLAAQGIHADSLSVSLEQATVTIYDCTMNFDMESVDGGPFRLYTYYGDGSRSVIDAKNFATAKRDCYDASSVS